jgi:trehalose synthase
LLDGRTLWNVNSTARGGGVAEMLRSLIGYVRGAGIDARWVVVPGDADFFGVTKRLHNRLHGVDDGASLGDAERAVYERRCRSSAEQLAALVRPHDVVLLHDPQTAGMIPRMLDTGAVIWRAHIGLDLPNDAARQAWGFLMPYVERATAYVFSRPTYIWAGWTPSGSP